MELDPVGQKPTVQISLRKKDQEKLIPSSVPISSKGNKTNQANSDAKKVANSNNSRKRRIKTPDKQIVCEEENEVSPSQQSVIIPRNAFKLKRLENSKK